MNERKYATEIKKNLTKVELGSFITHNSVPVR